MAKRPDNHITGDNAIREIAASLIPEEWTISYPDSDYGLDMLIEVVINNNTTGKHFFIQSKGTLDSSQDGIISYSLSNDRIKDYSKIELPVLFVYYSRAEKKFWGRWINQLYSSLTPKQKEQKNVSIRFTSKNLIDKDYLRSIGPELTLPLTKRISVVCDSIPKAFSRFNNQLFSFSQKELGSVITEDCHTAFETIRLSYEGAPTKGNLIISFQGDSIRIPVNTKSFDFLFYPSLRPEDCPDYFLDAVYVIAFLCSKYSLQCLDYVLSYPRQRALDVIDNSKWEEFIGIIPNDRIDRIHTLFEVAAKRPHSSISTLLLLLAFRSSINHKERSSIYKELLSSLLQIEKDDSSKGRTCYSLANAMRGTDLQESFSLYKKATRFETEYKNRYYWWEEVGGVLYLLGHPLFGELFYKKARSLDTELCRDDIGILISDCLIRQGKIKEAMEEERAYFDKSKTIESRILLKSIVSEMFAKQNIRVFDSVYWFNKGSATSIEGNHSAAADCFLFAWRLDDSKVEALAVALIEAINSQDAIKTTHILCALREQAPNEGYRIIVSILLPGTTPNKDTERVLDTIKNLLFSNNDHIG